MTVTSAVNTATYTAVGGEASVAVPFSVQRTGDLQVYRTQTGGVVTLLVYGTNYTIPASQLGNDTCQITLTVTATAGDFFQLKRVLPLLQDVDLRNQGAYLPETMEVDALDRIVEMIQATNTAVASLTAGSGGTFVFATVAPGGLPTASVANVGQVYRVTQGGQTDLYKVSTLLANATYAWTDFTAGGVTSQADINPNPLRVNGAATLSSTLAVTGATTLGSTVGVTGALTANSTLAVTGAATLNSTLAVTSGSTVGGASTLTGGIVGGIPRNVGTWQPPTATPGSYKQPVTTEMYVGSIHVPSNMTITGIQYLIGTATPTTQKVRAALYGQTGTRVAQSISGGTTMSTTASIKQQLAFDPGTYSAIGPGWYFIGLMFDTGTANLVAMIPAVGDVGSGVVGVAVTGQTSLTPPSTITVPITFPGAALVPIASIY